MRANFLTVETANMLIRDIRAVQNLLPTDSECSTTLRTIDEVWQELATIRRALIQALDTGSYIRTQDTPQQASLWEDATTTKTRIAGTASESDE